MSTIFDWIIVTMKDGSIIDVEDSGTFKLDETWLTIKVYEGERNNRIRMFAVSEIQEIDYRFER